MYSSKPPKSVLYMYPESTLQVGKLRLRNRRWSRATGHWGWLRVRANRRCLGSAKSRASVYLEGKGKG